MENDFDSSALHLTLSGLPFWKQLVFLLSVCQRLLPSYSAFEKESGLDGEKILQRAIDEAWSNLLAGRYKVDLSFYAHQCESIAPDTDEYSSMYVSSALDAAVATSLLMKAFNENNTKIIVDGISLIYDSIDMYIQEVEGMNPDAPDLEEKILSHDLMQGELKRQREDLEFLSSVDDNLIVAAPKLKDRWFGKIESCLGL